MKQTHIQVAYTTHLKTYMTKKKKREKDTKIKELLSHATAPQSKKINVIDRVNRLEVTITGCVECSWQK